MIINWKYAGGGSGGDIALPIVVVDSLPSASAETMNKIYLVPNSGSSTNVKDEYITWLDGSTFKWEKIGTTDVDLTNYYTKSETDNRISTAVGAITFNKLNVVSSFPASASLGDVVAKTGIDGEITWSYPGEEDYYTTSGTFNFTDLPVDNGGANAYTIASWSDSSENIYTVILYKYIYNDGADDHNYIRIEVLKNGVSTEQYYDFAENGYDETWGFSTIEDVLEIPTTFSYIDITFWNPNEDGTNCYITWDAIVAGESGDYYEGDLRSVLNLQPFAGETIIGVYQYDGSVWKKGEEAANKVTSISASSTDEEYPSAKCVYDIVGDVESVLTNIIGA